MNSDSSIDKEISDFQAGVSQTKHETNIQVQPHTDALDNHDLEKVTESEVYIQNRLFSFLHTKNIPEIPLTSERKDYPLYITNIISKIFFFWVIPLVRVGYKRTLQPNDLWVIEENLTIEYLHKKFQDNLYAVLEKNREKYTEEHNDANADELNNLPFPKYALVKALASTFKWQYVKATFYVGLANAASVFSPMLTKKLIIFVAEKEFIPDLKVNRGIGYAIGVVIIMLVNGLLFNHFFQNAMMTGAQVRTVLTKAMLSKSFRLSGTSKHRFPSGKIASMMATDLSRVDLALNFLPFVFVFPIPVIIAIAQLIVNLGAISLTGVSVFLVVSAITGSLVSFLIKIRKKINVYTDKRVTLMREILSSMKMIKFYAWEDAYEKNVQEIRIKETSSMKNLQYMRTLMFSMGLSLPNVASMVAFVAMYKIGRDQNPANIFSSLSLFENLALQMFFVPMALATCSDGLVALHRVQNYLETEEESRFIDEDKTPVKVVENAFEMENGTFEWEDFEEEEEDKKEGDKKEVALSEKKPLTKKEQSTFSGFHDLSFDIKRGEFVIITGPIGSGKSSLLNAMSGFMKRISGQVRVQGNLLLCGYPWVQNATVRENIIFGLPFDQQRYDRVIDCCSLQADLDIFTAGDMTEIGERGITLSGGQKARINLARAVYRSDTDVLLLDDVLSAVDARVGKHIMDECLMGLLKNTTRVLATHQLSLIYRADRVIFLDSKGNFDIGTVGELQTRQSEFVSLMEHSTATSTSNEQKNKLSEEKENTKNELSDKSEVEGRIVSKEERAFNAISWNIYKQYAKSGQGKMRWLAMPIYIFFVMLAGFCSIFTSTWLSFWTARKFPKLSSDAYMGIYIMFVFLTLVAMTFQFLIASYIGLSSSRVLNLSAVKRLLHTPMSFMDTTPLGRVLNRFTKDTDACDNELVDQISFLLYQAALLLGTFILCIVYLPWFAIAVPFLAFLLIAVTDHYQCSAREVKRLEAVQRSFVYNNFNEVLSGMNTIKAYHSEQRFLKKSDYLIDRMNEATYVVIAMQRWVAISLDFVAVMFSLIIALLCVTRQFKISASSTGLLLTYVLQLSGMLNNFLRSMTDTENHMNSVERLVTYATDLPQEAEYHSLTRQPPPPEWPENGAISFKNVALAYRPELPVVLKNVSLEVKPSEKIGVCGRTGAGKSTIMSALYRLVELSDGSIEIDGIDISKIGLYDLRSKLSIIPQDPVLFRGNIRKNLDPFGEMKDDQLWSALVSGGAIDEKDIANVIPQNKSSEQMHKFHLDQDVEDDGANFSLGEKQILALTRALVRHSKISILDEATSSVDYETDAKIQSRIVEAFSQCTILCIAHRLKTILQYDRILVLEKGEIAEFATPWELYQQGGIFREMCDRSGIAASDF